MLHMLDTDTASYLIKGKSPTVEAKLAELVPSKVCISVMTRAELQYGLKRLPAEHRLHLAVRHFLSWSASYRGTGSAQTGTRGSVTNLLVPGNRSAS